MRLYISPSGQTMNQYVVGGTNEKQQMEALARILVTKLAAYDCEVKLADLMLGIQKTGRATEAYKWGADFYFALHSNAGGSGKASGPEGYYHSKKPIGKTFCETAVKCINAITPIKSNRANPIQIADTKFGEVRSPYEYGIPAVLFEVEFHDNVTTAQWIIDCKEEIAQALVKAIVTTFNIKKKNEIIHSIEPEITQHEIAKPEIKIGDFVKIKDGANYYQGKPIPAWVISDIWQVDKVQKDRVVLGGNRSHTNNIMSPVYISDLTVERE